MTFFDNITNAVDSSADVARESFKAGADLSTQMWDGLKEGVKTTAKGVQDFEQDLAFDTKNLFESASFDIGGSMSLGGFSAEASVGVGNRRQDGRVRDITDGSSNTVQIGERDGVDNGCGQRDHDGRRDDEYNRDERREEGRNRDERNDDARYDDRDGHNHGGHDRDRRDNNDSHNHDREWREHEAEWREHEREWQEHERERHEHEREEHGYEHGHHGRENGNGEYEYENGEYQHYEDACNGESWNNGDNFGSPAEMMQRMDSIAQEIAQLTALMAAMQGAGFTGGIGASAAIGGGAVDAGMAMGVGFNPAQAIGQIAELAKQLAPLASALAPALIALI